MMHIQTMNSISTTLNDIQSLLKQLHEKHQQTDATVTNLKASLEEIKSSGYKRKPKSPPGLSVSTILLYIRIAIYHCVL